MNSKFFNQKIKSSYIRKHPLFKHLDEDTFTSISGKAGLIKLRKSNPFLLNDDAASKIYFLSSGTAKQVSFNSNGNDFVKDILVDGEIFGDFSFTGQSTNGYVVGLRPNTYIFCFFTADFKKMLQQNHLLSLNYAESISMKLRMLEDRHAVWTSKDARQRLLYFLRGWSQCAGTRTSSSVILENYFSLTDIAEFIGVSRQFLHIMLKELKEEELVFYSRKEITVSNIFLSQGMEEKRKAI